MSSKQHELEGVCCVSVQQSGKIGRRDKPKNQEKVSLQQIVSFQCLTLESSLSIIIKNIVF
ncbi:MAG: hypothetical protein ACEY3F_06600 [Wolbachia sp.]